MKSLLVLAAVAVVVIANAIAAMPAGASSARNPAAQNAAPVLMMAEQELPFDRYWSKD
jgi:hypothetical protein